LPSGIGAPLTGSSITRAFAALFPTTWLTVGCVVAATGAGASGGFEQLAALAIARIRTTARFIESSLQADAETTTSHS
jgi:hypothetical protein